jgi:hypothetical protein
MGSPPDRRERYTAWDHPLIDILLRCVGFGKCFAHKSG